MSSHDHEPRESDDTFLLRTMLDNSGGDASATSDGEGVARGRADNGDPDPEVAVDSDHDDLYPYETGGRLSRSTSVIAGLLLAAGLILTGMQIQFHFGSAQTQAASTAAAPAGLSFGGQAGATGGGAAGTGGENTSTTPANSAMPAVIGTVVATKHGHVIVKDIGGTKHTVDVAASVNIQMQSTINAGQLKTGESVTVVGVTNDNGHIDATSITARQPTSKK